MGISDTINWYGRTFPKLDREGENEALAKDDPKSELVMHSVFHVVRGLVLEGKKLTASSLSSVIGQMYDDVGRWIDSDRSRLCCEFLLGTISSGFNSITREDLLVNKAMFKSLDAPVGSGVLSHGGEATTLLDLISITYAGKPGSSLDSLVRDGEDEDGSHVRMKDGLEYDPVLDAYVRKAAVADRKTHVRHVRAQVENGIYSYSDEVRHLEERRIESFSPIRSSKISDRIVVPTKAKRKRYARSFRGHFWFAPGPGKSAALAIPLSCRSKSESGCADFTINRTHVYRFPVKCLGCVLFEACSSWLCGGYFSRGIHCPHSCGGPFVRGDFIK